MMSPKFLTLNYTRPIDWGEVLTTGGTPVRSASDIPSNDDSNGTFDVDEFGKTRPFVIPGKFCLGIVQL